MSGWTENPFDVFVAPSPLHRVTALEVRGNEWGAREGMTLARAYAGEAAERAALHHGVALADLSFMPRLRLWGPQAAACLDRLVTRDVARLPSGQGMDALMCDDAGHVIALIGIDRLGADDFTIAAPAGVHAWIEDGAMGFDVALERMAPRAVIGVLGPRAEALLRAAGFDEALPLGEGGLRPVILPGGEAMLARRAPPGCAGYEIMLAADEGPALWARLMRAGAALGVIPAGLDALEAARVAAGLPRLGHDAPGALGAETADAALTPAELGLDALVDGAKQAFNGRRALAGAQQRKRLVRLRLDLDALPQSALFMRGGTVLAAASSLALSPAGEAVLALALLPAGEAASGARLEALAAMPGPRGVRPVIAAAEVLAE